MSSDIRPILLVEDNPMDIDLRTRSHGLRLQVVDEVRYDALGDAATTASR